MLVDSGTRTSLQEDSVRAAVSASVLLSETSTLNGFIKQ